MKTASENQLIQYHLKNDHENSAAIGHENIENDSHFDHIININILKIKLSRLSQL